MTSRVKIARIFAHDATCRPGFWTGEPVAETMTRYLAELGLSERGQLFDYLHDDCRWLPVWGYQHPEGKEAFDVLRGQKRTSFSQPGCFAECAGLQLQVSCNANTAFDMATLRQLAIVDTNGDVLVDLAGRITAGQVTTGLAIGRRTDTDPATFASSGAACTAQDGVVYVHPGWNNALSYPCVIQVPVTLP